jgi:hypothetical protein
VQQLRIRAKNGCTDHSRSPVFVLHTPELYGRVVTYPPALNCEVLGSTPDHGRYKDRNLGGSARQAWVQAFCPVQDRQPFCCGEFLHCPFSMELVLSAASLPHNSVMKLPDQNTPSRRTSRRGSTPIVQGSQPWGSAQQRVVSFAHSWFLCPHVSQPYLSI